ncbi:uncharacterized protein, YkwD family [Halobacteroides halobius DSM 5150]|uniref:Uncharacterized protein, YkwD family n=1 Tax=Halobacteroides halobius (strain ATCC 35273 / DSM 5150 / MD-1) TaxID=748449 RepID=L0KA00_HALHC|nr:CAP domain-containing protein [Halobacteroides halobius]AGB41821.1 uncharacterized protein, YkwD family [Halobacteroides halobius DSM 5150]
MKKIKFWLVLSLVLGLLVGNTISINAQNYRQQDQNQNLLCIIKYGDSLWKISQRYDINLEKIIQANPQIEDPNLIYPGDRIYETKGQRQRKEQKQPEKERQQQPTSLKAMEKKIVALVNQERQKQGLKPYQHNPKLSKVARTKAQDMVKNNYFSHTSPTYGSPFEMLSQFNVSYRTAGENIAQGQRTAQQVMNAWMNSPGHRRNILNQRFTQIGVGLAKDEDGTPYWVQMFIKP